MNLATSFERRVASLIAEYAERAPTDVDPVAMAQLAMNSGRPALREFEFGWRMPRLGLVLVVLALTMALTGSVLLSGGSLPFWRDQTWVPVEGVPPFMGLAPEAAAASVPETGELVLRFAARMPALGWEAQQSFLYADGRLIWQRNLEGSESAQAIFGNLEPTKAVIEQRLTPEGVALVRADVLASMGYDPADKGPGTEPWGGIELVIDGRLQPIDWIDAHLPARLADPGSWLPESAWADRQLRGYVPSRYAVCLEGGLDLADLPPAAFQLLRGVVGSAGPGNPVSIGTCYEVATDVARDISATLDAARFEPCETCGIGFHEILPDGEIFLRGG